VKKLRILLVDDHEMFREGIRLLLGSQTDFEVVGEASDGEEARRKIEALRPDLVVMDVSMPRGNGVQLMEYLKRSGSVPRVLVLTAFSDSAYLRQMLAAGAAGYVLKRAASEELIEAIRVVAAGRTYLDPGVAGSVVSGFIEQKKVRGSRAGDEITERERQVLCDVAQGFTNREIASRLQISVKTVETHKAKLREKLGLRSRAEIVRYALQQGWLKDE
jgi:DNA-binding NarL/FixJ family response regulator